METNTSSTSSTSATSASEALADRVRARMAAGETPGDVAAALGLRLAAADDGHDHDHEVVVLPGFVADDGNAEVEYPEATSGSEAARAYVDDGDFGDLVSTLWHTVYVWQVGLGVDEDGEVVEICVGRDSHRVEIEPDVPACAHGRAHEWRAPYSVLGGLRENPGVWGNGGGAIIKQICRHCGRYRITNTWAQDCETGEQGLTSVCYEDADEQSRAWTRRRDLADLREHLGVAASLRLDHGRIFLDEQVDADAIDARVEQLQPLLPEGWRAEEVGGLIEIDTI